MVGDREDRKHVAIAHGYKPKNFERAKKAREGKRPERKGGNREFAESTDFKEKNGCVG